jgi:hypothetical protein
MSFGIVRERRHLNFDEVFWSLLFTPFVYLWLKEAAPMVRDRGEYRIWGWSQIY